jgi:hypothetical protein
MSMHADRYVKHLPRNRSDIFDMNETWNETETPEGQRMSITRRYLIELDLQATEERTWEVREAPM